MADVGDREVLCFRLRGWAEMVSQLRRVACHRKTAAHLSWQSVSLEQTGQGSCMTIR